MILLIIAEDLELRLLIKNQLKRVKAITTILESGSAEDALFVLLEKDPQIIVASDILPGRNGFKLAYLLQKINFKSPFIILSNNSGTAIDAIRSKVFDYLIYPFAGDKLVAAVQRAIGEIEKEKKAELKSRQIKNMKVKLSIPNGFQLVDLNLLSHCKADGSYTELHFISGQVEYLSYNLGKLEDVLEEYQFVRINRSMIVNMQMLKDIDEKEEICTIDTGKELLKFKVTKLCVKKLAKKHFL